MMREEPETFKQNVDASKAGRSVKIGKEMVSFPRLLIA
jgi:hypothetical protein